MGTVTIQIYTYKNPITMIGEQAGICYGADTTNEEKNYKRGLECLKSNHGRTLEFPDIYMVISGYSAKVIREWYTHIGGSPTRLQASTRYIDYEHGFEYVTPPSIANNPKAKEIYDRAISEIQESMKELDDIGIPREDSSMAIPLGMETVMVCKHNLRNLIDMSHQRMCTRAFHEYRELFGDLCNALSDYSAQYKHIVDEYFKPKCELYGVCIERKSCGRKLKI